MDMSAEWKRQTDRSGELLSSTKDELGETMFLLTRLSLGIWDLLRTPGTQMTDREVELSTCYKCNDNTL